MNNDARSYECKRMKLNETQTTKKMAQKAEVEAWPDGNANLHSNESKHNLCHYKTANFEFKMLILCQWKNFDKKVGKRYNTANAQHVDWELPTPSLGEGVVVWGRRWIPRVARVWLSVGSP